MTIVIDCDYNDPMKNSFLQSRAFAYVCIFAFWAFLRFFLIGLIRKFIFQHFDIVGAEKVLLNHGLIIVEALMLFAVYSTFRGFKRTEDFHLMRGHNSVVKYGLLSGFVIFVLTFPIANLFGMKFFFQFDHVGFIGNLFSNAAEEVIYRGILYSAALLLFKNSWFSIFISAVMFGVGHWDLPYLFQAYIVSVGFILGWTFLRTKSLVSPFMAHMIADVLADSFFH